MTNFTILVDNREKKPYKFSRRANSTESIELTTGDYCIEDDGTWDQGKFSPNFAIERKNPDDFLNSITWERDRFEAELSRADSFDARMPIIVEKPWEHFMKDRHFRDVHPNSIEATVETHPERYNVEYFFTRDRKKARELTFEYLDWRAGQLNL